MSDTDPPVSYPESSPAGELPLVEALKREFLGAMTVIDNEVPRLIADGQEMRALTLLTTEQHKVVELHERLNTLYLMVLRNRDVLKRFGSPRYARLGGDPIATWEVRKKSGAGKKDWEYLSETMQAFRTVNYVKQHWAFPDLVVTEIHYMLAVLASIVEPTYQ
jgi:hypothetical protein